MCIFYGELTRGHYKLTMLKVLCFGIFFVGLEICGKCTDSLGPLCHCFSKLVLHRGHVCSLRIKLVAVPWPFEGLPMSLFGGKSNPLPQLAKGQWNSVRFASTSLTLKERDWTGLVVQNFNASLTPQVPGRQSPFWEDHF